MRFNNSEVFASNIANVSFLWDTLYTDSVAQRVLAGYSREMSREEALYYRENTRAILSDIGSFPSIAKA